MDNQATTPLDPRVHEAMTPYFMEIFGNPHSKDHSFGWSAHEAVENARRKVASLVNADAREIIFMSGATESCNLALKGIAQMPQQRRNKIVTVATEHSCVLETCRELEKQGFNLEIIPVSSDGLVSLQKVENAIDDETLIVSVMLANNEIGVIQPIAEIASVCKENGALLHCDATQAVGKIPVDVEELKIDFMSFSAHKFYGPKGIGALYSKWKLLPRIKPVIHGGGQESKVRGGTLPVPNVVGFGEACNIAIEEIEKDMHHTKGLAVSLYESLRSRIPGIKLLGHPEKRLPGNLSIAFPDISGEEIVASVGDRLAISTGSACNSTTAKTSHVLEALKLKENIGYNTVRISLGRFNTSREVEAATKILCKAAHP